MAEQRTNDGPLQPQPIGEDDPTIPCDLRDYIARFFEVTDQRGLNAISAAWRAGWRTGANPAPGAMLAQLEREREEIVKRIARELDKIKFAPRTETEQTVTPEQADRWAETGEPPFQRRERAPFVRELADWLERVSENQIGHFVTPIQQQAALILLRTAVADYSRRDSEPLLPCSACGSSKGGGCSLCATATRSAGNSPIAHGSGKKDGGQGA